MGRKINVNLLSVFVFLVLSLIFYYPILFNKIPFNGNLLVSLWPPLNFLKWPEFPAGVPFKFMGVDEVREFYPLLDFTFDSFRSLTLPLWNPYNFSGYSHIGDYASAVFYPLHIFMFVLGKPYMLIVLKLSVSLLAGVFTYVYLRVIKLSKISSYFGAIAFAFSSTMQIWTSELWQSAHSFLWLPLVLFSIEKILSEKKNKFVILLGLSIAMSIMGGYIQPTIYLLIIGFLYSIFRIFDIKKNKLSIAFRLATGLLLGFGVSAVQLFPAIEAYMLSPRSQVTLHDLNISFLLSLWQIVTFFIPDFFGNIATGNWMLHRPGQYYESMIYVGLVPVLLTCLSIWNRQYKKYVMFFTVTFLISLSFTFDLPTSRLIYDFSLPFLSSAIPIRIIFVTVFAVSVLSAIGFEWWIGANSLKKTFLSILPVSIIFTVVGGFIFYAFYGKLVINSFPTGWYEISFKNFVIPAFTVISAFGILLVGQFVKKNKIFFGSILITGLFFSSFFFAHKYIVFSNEKFIYPNHQLFEFIKMTQGLDRYWGYGSASLPNNFATIYKIYSPEGYDPVNNSSYNELLSSARKGVYDGIFSRSDALLYPVTEFPFKNIDDPRYRIMDMLGVKYLGFEKGELSKIDASRMSQERYEKIWEKNNFIVFENKKAYSRVYLADRFILRTDKKESINELYDKNIDFAKTVISSENIPIKESESTGSAKIINYSQNRITVETDTLSPKILVLSDSFYPGWKAKINNMETKIYKVNSALRAAVVPKGKNIVEIYYEPLSFYLGVLISCVSILLAIFFTTKRNYVR